MVGKFARRIPRPSFEKEHLIKFYEPQDRTPLLPALLTLWEASVRATHLFLSDAEILHIKEYVPPALLGVAHLIVAETDDLSQIQNILGAH